MIITVASGKGGTGKTTVASSLSLLIPHSVYVDTDVEEPNGHLFLHPEIEETKECLFPVPLINENICTFCGLCARHCAFHALTILKEQKKVLYFPQLCHNCGTCSYVCPVEGALREVFKKKGIIRKGKASFKGNEIDFIDGIMNIGEPSPTPIIKQIKKLIKKDKIAIVDAPPGTGCPMVESIEMADFVVLVTEPTPFGINDLKLAIEVVKHLKKDFGIIINKDRGETVQEFSSLPILLKIPFKRQFAYLYSQGKVLIEDKEGEGLFLSLKKRLGI
ncbi:MAG: 4Fe-4S dicluster domain-containing protein [Deltaproteobacteria bacterium]|nr:4Fe-4S dicluster domain-containing protein [Deltaproteobacteria bacterium]